MTGLHNAYTQEEAVLYLPGGRLLPGIIYNHMYIPLSTAARFAISCLNKKIGGAFDGYTRYLDLGNGAVLRWNRDFDDDYGTTTFAQEEEGWVATYSMDGNVANMKLADDDMIIRLIRENTGNANIDDVNVLRMMLVFVMCVTWASGKLYYGSKGLLGYCYEKSGYGEALCRVQEGWSSMCTQAYNEAGEHVFECVHTFAGFVGLSKALKKAPDLALPKRMLRVVRHRCYKAVPRLLCFENLGGLFCGPDLNQDLLLKLENGLKSLISTGTFGAAPESFPFLVISSYVEPDVSRLKFL